MGIVKSPDMLLLRTVALTPLSRFLLKEHFRRHL